jgi:hypothetical protein
VTRTKVHEAALALAQSESLIRKTSGCDAARFANSILPSKRYWK